MEKPTPIIIPPVKIEEPVKTPNPPLNIDVYSNYFDEKTQTSASKRRRTK